MCVQVWKALTRWKTFLLVSQDFQVWEVTEDIFQESQVADMQEAGEDLVSWNTQETKVGDEASEVDWDHIVMGLPCH